jgi:adenylate cyclase
MFFTGWVHQLRGDSALALAHTDELIALSDEHGFPMYQAAGRLLKGVLLAGQGKGEEGIPLIREGIEGHRGSGTVLGKSVWSGGWLVEGLLSIGAAAEADQGIDEALEFVERSGERFHEPELWRLKAAIRRQQADGPAAGEQVETALRKAIAVAQRSSARSLELRAAMDLARLLRGRDGIAKANAELAKVYQQFSEGFDTADLREARALLEPSAG